MMEVRFHGVRGSVPTPDIRMLAHGGNTSCVEVRSESQQRLIIDAGTGIIHLPVGDATEHHIFLTHYHRDHIEGLQHFAPLFDCRHSVIFHAPARLGSIRAALAGFFTSPYTPITLETFAATVQFDEFDSFVRLGALSVSAFELHHPQGSFGYRVEEGRSSVVHASDHEHGNRTRDDVLRSHAANADLLIFDAHYTPEEYSAHQGWGHATWLEATRVARCACVRRLVLFHHSPARTDDELSSIVVEARVLFPNTEAAREHAAPRMPVAASAIRCASELEVRS